VTYSTAGLALLKIKIINILAHSERQGLHPYDSPKATDWSEYSSSRSVASMSSRPEPALEDVGARAADVRACAGEAEPEAAGVERHC
jgi:hypothetical protein